MYKQFFGLNENPFNVNPDPRYLYLTAQTREALDELTYGIQARKGLILLTGEVGTGKTTLINRLLDWLHQQQTPTAFIFNSHLETRHLLDFILTDFEVPLDTRMNGNALRCLNQWLFERYRAGDVPVLIVDEAQGLPTSVLEEIRLLLNLETPHEKLLQIVLAGQPELEERLKQPDLRQLKQRIMLRCKTAALTLEETHDYINARLHIAGANGQPVFASQAVDAVHFYSRGIPRVTNLLCEHALIHAYVDSIRPVPAHIVEEVAREFELDDITSLTPSIDCQGGPAAGTIAARPAPGNGLAPPPEEAGPLVQEDTGTVANWVSLPYGVADNLPTRAQEFATLVSDCEAPLSLTGSRASDIPAPVMASSNLRWTVPRKPSCSTAFDSGTGIELGAGLTMEQLASGFSPLLHVVKAKEKLHPSPVLRRCQVAAPQKVAHRPRKVQATRSSPISSMQMRLLGLYLSLAHESARLRNRLLFAIRSLPWAEMTATLRSRLQRSLQVAGALCRWRPVLRGGRQSVFDSAEWLRRKAFVYEWLRQPFDPTQLRLPYSWFFEARRRLSQKRM